MHSFWQRLNAIFFYTLSVLGFLAFMAAGTTHWHTAEPAVTVSLKKIMLCARATLFAPNAARTRLGEPRLTASPYVCLVPRRKIHGAGHDQAILSLQLDADLRSVFNWNVKQLFVYVTAEYETEANVLNQVVVWDQIISEPQHAWIRSSSVANK